MVIEDYYTKLTLLHMSLNLLSRVEDISTENVETFYLLDFAGPQEFAVELAKRAKQ
jgi:hypothetical protein